MRTLGRAVWGVVREAHKDGRLLRVSEAANRLAAERGCDRQEVAEMITKAGVIARINMELDGTAGQRRPTPQQ
jgi:hypothetical protein